MLTYHELTIDEPRDSPARRQQFLILCSIIAGFTLYSVITSGAYKVINISKTKFDGGEFVYKFGVRDYAASNSLLESIKVDMGASRKTDVFDTLYSVYLDDPYEIGGDGLRFGCGLLLTDDTAGGKQKIKNYDDDDKNGKKEKLLSKNKVIIPIKTEKEFNELAVSDIWNRTKYESAKFPSVEAAYFQHPYNDGVVAALVQSYKIIPALRDYAKKNGRDGSVPVVISTCSIKQQMCTHYAPLEQGTKFLLSQKDTETHKREMAEVPSFSEKLNLALARVLPGYKYLMSNSEEKDEL